MSLLEAKDSGYDDDAHYITFYCGQRNLFRHGELLHELQRKPPFFNGTRYSECSASLANARKEQLANLEQSVASSRGATAEQLALLRGYDRKTVLGF